MRDNGDSECDGVDLNRNFAKAYGTASSKNPCAEDFREWSIQLSSVSYFFIYLDPIQPLNPQTPTET